MRMIVIASLLAAAVPAGAAPAQAPELGTDVERALNDPEPNPVRDSVAAVESADVVVLTGGGYLNDLRPLRLVAAGMLAKAARRFMQSCRPVVRGSDGGIHALHGRDPCCHRRHSSRQARRGAVGSRPSKRPPPAGWS